MGVDCVERRSSTQARNIRGILKCRIWKTPNNGRSSTQAPNIRGILKYNIWKTPNNGCSSTQEPNIRGVLQCSTSTFTIKDEVQHKHQI